MSLKSQQTKSLNWLKDQQGKRRSLLCSWCSTKLRTGRKKGPINSHFTRCDFPWTWTIYLTTNATRNYGREIRTWPSRKKWNEIRSQKWSKAEFSFRKSIKELTVEMNPRSAKKAGNGKKGFFTIHFGRFRKKANLSGKDFGQVGNISVTCGTIAVIRGLLMRVWERCWLPQRKKWLGETP